MAKRPRVPAQLVKRVFDIAIGEAEEYGAKRTAQRKEANMTASSINRISTIAHQVMSLSAFILVLVAVAAGWDKGMQDEGSATHIFQLLIVLQVPFILAFLVTADWKRFMRVAGMAILQIAAVGLALGPVVYFKL